ncbi:MAG: STAS domain-containing protein [Planctomycetia bacterium]
MDISIEERAVAGGSERIDLVLRGRIDIETSTELETAVDGLLHRGVTTIRLDLAAVGFLSSAGIRSLFNVTRAAKGAGGSCLVSVASDPVLRVLTLTKLAPLLMEQATAAPAAVAPTAAAPRRETVGRVELVDATDGAASSVAGRLLGTLAWTSGGETGDTGSHDVPRHAFGLGIGSLADEGPAPACGGELLAACGSVFLRPPRPFAAPDSLVASGNLVPAVRMVSGLLWEGVPGGRTHFEPAADADAITLPELLGPLFDRLGVDSLAVVIVAEVHGRVGAELIRPVGEDTAADNPAAARADVVSRWLSFSREPVHAGRTALVVGVVARPGGLPDAFVRPLDGGAGRMLGHFHAAVFPARPPRRGATDVAAVVDDLAGSAPPGVMHLLADPEPVLGSGQSEFVRGTCWYAPLHLRGVGT